MKKIYCFLVTALVVLSIPALSFAGIKELSFAAHFGPKNPILNEVMKPWAAELEKRTNGEVTVKFYIGQTLAKTRDEYDAVVDNIADLSWNMHSFNKGRFPLISVMELPFLSPSTEAGTLAFNELYNMFPKMQKEHADVHNLYLWTSLPYQLHTRNKPVRTLEDLKGMKLTCTPGLAKTLQALGAVPVPMPPPKMYEILEKGVADGVVLPWTSFKAWKLDEITKYHTKVGFGGITTWNAMNKSTWNKLSPEVQKVITEISADLPMQTVRSAATNRDIAIEIVKKEGHVMLELTAKERARWVAKTAGIKAEWIKTMEAKGLPGKKVVEAAIKLVAKYSK